MRFSVRFLVRSVIFIILKIYFLYLRKIWWLQEKARRLVCRLPYWNLSEEILGSLPGQIWSFYLTVFTIYFFILGKMFYLLYDIKQKHLHRYVELPVGPTCCFQISKTTSSFNLSHFINKKYSVSILTYITRPGFTYTFCW